MNETNSTRRSFLKLIGLTAGATITASGALAKIADHSEIHKLNPAQQEFMLRYGQWMDEFIEVIAIQKTFPDDSVNNQKLMQLSDQAQIWQPQLTEYMKEESFALIYRASIEKMRNEI
ncbi:MAG TPA: twin-arginine translocation signal domain-containing protein [Bacteroidia bacterium]|nr:twin-arginine translocation signal domain-containing protein [Bacteroidia bacterium]